MRSLPFNVQGVLNSSRSFSLANTFPNVAYSLITDNAAQLRTAYVDVNPPRSYTMQWNFNVEHDFFGFITTIGYDGSRGVHLVQVERNMNTVQPTLSNGGWTYPEAFGQKLNPNFGTINTTDTWNADSTYAAGHVSVKRNFRRGLLMQGSYAFGKSIDNSSSTSSVTAGIGYRNAIGNPAPLFPMINRGLSDFDIRHNAVISVVWQVPRMSVGVRGLQAAMNGWEISSILTARTGFPFTVVLNNDRANVQADTIGGSLGERPNLTGAPGCRTLTNPGNITNYIKKECFSFPAANTLGNESRNALTAPGFQNIDFALLKNDRFGERFSTQLRLEAFNFFNHPNFNAPSFVLYNASGNVLSNAGVITSTVSNVGRQIQFGMKLMW
jgi:hypothetical protein